MKKVLMYIGTTGLDYDERLKKEVLSLKGHADVFIQCFLSGNTTAKGATEYGTAFQSTHILHNSFPESVKKNPFLNTYLKLLRATRLYVLFREIEKFAKTYNTIKQHDVIWLHDFQMFLMPLLIRTFLPKKKIIWDLHELPVPFLGSTLKKKLFRFLSGPADLVISANEERKQFLLSEGFVNRDKQHIVIRNFSTKEFCEKPKEELRDRDVQAWLGNGEYILLLSGGLLNRYFTQAINASLKNSYHKIVVIGGLAREHRSEYKALIKAHADRIYYTGYLKNTELLQYIDNCRFGIVLYKTSLRNSLLSESNRFYQMMARRKHFIASRTLTIENASKLYDGCVLLKEDGRDEADIASAIKIIEGKTGKNGLSLSYPESMTWEGQEEYMINELKSLL